MPIKKLVLAVLGCSLVPVAAVAQQAGPYVHLGGGVDLLQNEDVRPSGAGPAPRHYSFDPGGAAVAALGYRLGNGLRIEAEGSYAYSHVHGVTLDSSQPSERAGGHQQQYGGFANLLYDVPLGLPVRPYFGLGAGYREIELDQVNSSGFGARPGNAGGGSETRGNFAYQGIAGLAIPTPVPGLSLSLEYRLIGVLSPGAYYRGTERSFVTTSGSGVAAAESGVVREVVARPFGIREVDIREHTTFNNIFDHEILVGLTYAFGTRAAAVPVPPPLPVAELAAAARTYLVFFGWDRSDLTGRARMLVEQAAQASIHVQSTRLEIDGYADTSSIHGGDRGLRYNQDLSVRRARSVQAELIRDGVPGDAIEIHGHGEADPLVATGPDVREPQNRRVEIVLR